MRDIYFEKSENRHTDLSNLKGAKKRQKYEKKVKKKENKLTKNGKRKVTMLNK